MTRCNFKCETTSFKFVQCDSKQKKSQFCTGVMDKTEDKELLQKCLAEIENQLNWGRSESWHSDIFNELSEKIHEQTSVMLSPTTLKRVWGRVSYKSAPSISTLNTLAQFAGFDNWRAFKAAQVAPAKAPVKIEQEAPQPKKRRGVLAVAAVLVGALVVISFFAMTGQGNEAKPTTLIGQDIPFECKRVNDELPTSVVFDFDLAGLTTDSLYIQQFWDPRRTIKLNKDQTQATGIYYFPGYFRARLLADGDTLAQRDLFIKSNGWTGTIDYDPVPKYLHPTQFTTDRGFGLNEELLKEIAQSEKRLTTTYHLIDEFKEVSGDNFHLEATLQNVYHEKWAVCEAAGIYVIGSKGALIIPFSALGCISNNSAMLNDNFIDGKKNDLSALGIGLSEAKHIAILNDNRKITVMVDGQPIYSNQYETSMGDFVGMRFKFLGAGTVTNLQLQDAYGELVAF